MSVIALAFAAALAAQGEPVVVDVAAQATAPSPLRFTLDLPLVLTAQPPTNGVDSYVVGWLGPRGGLQLALGDLFVVGGDVSALLGDYESSGTPQVSMTRIHSMLEARGLAGAHASSADVELLGFGWASVAGGFGLGLINAYEDGRARILGTAGMRVGVGALVRLFFATLRLELGGGVRDFKPEVVSSLALGLSF